MIRFRKEHRVLRANVNDGACGFPDVSYHGVTPWQSEFKRDDRYVGVMFTGWERETGPQVVYVASNAYWGELEVELPQLPLSMKWELQVDTWNEEQQTWPQHGSRFRIGPRSVKVFVAR